MHRAPLLALDRDHLCTSNAGGLATARNILYFATRNWLSLGGRNDRSGSCVDGAHGSRDFFGFLLAVGCKSCVRPVCAVLMTAGPDVIRRSGPYQNLALDSA